MLDQQFKNKVLFVFSDPGGAKPCLSLIEENNLKNVIAISDRQYPFYKDFNTPVNILIQDFEQFIDNEKPDLIFTGTSYTSDIEQQFIVIALKKSITCYSFVDHWTSIAQRFENLHGEVILPDKIWVIDKQARLLAIKQGIDKSKIVISGNPYHNWLLKWKPTIGKDDFIKQIGINNKNKKLLLYAPDPLSNVNGKERYGFDECSATLELVDLFRIHQTELSNWVVIIKPHPNQLVHKIENIIKDNISFILLPNDTDTNVAIFYANIVMGFFSSILIEAAIMNKSILRFLISNLKNDPIKNLHIGKIISKKDFVSTLNKE